MAYYNRRSAKSVDTEPVGAEALRGKGVHVVRPTAAQRPPERRAVDRNVVGPTLQPYDPPAGTGHVEPARQAAALKAAAQAGTPFCEECERSGGEG